MSRALTLLTAFTDQDQGLTVTELARRAELYKSTALRLLGTLQAHGFIERREDGLYYVGAAVWRLGRIFEDSRDLHSIVMPVLNSVTERIDETTIFSVPEDGKRVNVAYAEGNQQVRVQVKLGAITSLERGGASRVMTEFANGPGEKRGRDLLQSSFGERNPDMASVAAPVFDNRGILLGAISAVGPVTRFENSERLEKIKTAVLDGAREMARVLGADLAPYDSAS